MSESNHQNSMYGSGGAPQSNQVEEQEDDVEESIDNPHIRFEDSNAIPPNPLYLTSSEYPPAAVTNGGSDQLTLSFQGEVYVFDEVSPDKAKFFRFWVVLNLSVTVFGLLVHSVLVISALFSLL